MRSLDDWPEPRTFIEKNLRLLPAPSVPEIRLHTAHPASGLGRLTGRNSNAPPYWAYRWAGGTALARYLLDRPEIVAGKRVIDLGCGSGIVGIAAAKCGANHVTAIDIDSLAIVATELNAEANGVIFQTLHGDILGGPIPEADMVLAGDLFYAPGLASDVLAFFVRCRAGGIDMLIGDPGRDPLPHERLRRLADYPVADFGDAGHATLRLGGIFTL